MATVHFNAETYPVAAGDSLLDALLEGGADVAYSCKNGTCLSCLLRAPEADIPAEVQRGLRDTTCHSGGVLPCVWRPAGDENIRLEPFADSERFIAATVLDKTILGEDFCALRLQPDDGFSGRPGQFINLRDQGGAVRSYSIAEVGASSVIELHVRRLRNGLVSNWIHDRLVPGDRIDIEGAFGDCFYVQNDASQPLLLIGTGSGAAPLWGIVRDAMAAGHRGPIYFYHGSSQRGGHYLHRRLQIMQETIAQFHYCAALSNGDAGSDCRAGRADSLALADHPNLSGWRVYLCGNPEMVKSARKKAFLAGAALNDIYADPFELRDLRQMPR